MILVNSTRKASWGKANLMPGYRSSDGKVNAVRTSRANTAREEMSHVEQKWWPVSSAPAASTMAAPEKCGLSLRAEVNPESD